MLRWQMTKITAALFILVSTLLFMGRADARRPIRNAFFANYPSAVGTRLDELASNASHCGVCHFDFDGGGARNPYGLAVEVARNSGLYATDEEAILSIEDQDSDNDGYDNIVEILDVLSFTNTPTFPGLSASQLGSVLNVNTAEIDSNLTPAGSADTDLPVVTVTWPVGGEQIAPNTMQNVMWTATDATSAISHVDIYLSDDNGAHFKPVARLEPDDGVYEWYVPNRPGTQNIVRVAARDAAGNYGSGDSPAIFEINPYAGPGVPTTLRDFDQPGTQPLEGVVLDDPDSSCRTCHGDYNVDIEPWYLWKGSMMAQAMRDPIFLATLAVAEQDAPAVGDMCLRCHTPGGWLEGRSTDTLGGLLTAKDRQGVQCDYCHRLVDPVYVEGVSPSEDEDLIAELEQVPPDYANGMVVVDPNPIRRGPYADAQASHQFLDSAFHRSGDLCGSCHNVSNPVFVSDGDGTYSPDTLNQQHPDNTTGNSAPVERTFAEWLLSDYANGGVYAPQFAGDKLDGIVSTCQDCHMADTTGKGSNQNSPNRTDLAKHDLTGGNHFIPDIIPTFFGGEVDAGRLQAGKARAIAMLQKAATLNAAQGAASGMQHTVDVEVINETGHKLPTGYPEGRQMWLNVIGRDAGNNVIYESGHFDPATGAVDHDPDAKIYHTEPGISTLMSSIVGLPVGPSFHFALNDSICFDNRIPPRGFDNAAFAAAQAAPVGQSYADGAHSDVTNYVMPLGTASVEVNLYYQSTSKEYIEFLRDENMTNSWGTDLYDAWVAQGRCAPVLMATQTVALDATAVNPGTRYETGLAMASPNPFNPSTEIHYSMARPGKAKLVIYDVAGRQVRTLLDQRVELGEHFQPWNGRDDRGHGVASGAYVVRFTALGVENSMRVVLLK